ncbi:preprotein translocase subunit YajC [Methylocystis heyeri]|uniref:Sec translocon accessory complex subunit YajC n=1 Tax=Methylocystis heyeri TaxID=391905 RepID=A0A6B8KCT9_9HYPH|nr:preprotein translocase subunit YajC [Methylocystis heyeri]QGM44223.1 preprotein translocase subunit YajC [Methylocystis heyeri]
MKLIPEAMAQTEQTPAPAAPAPKTTTSTGAQQPGGADAPPSLPDLFAQIVPVLVIIGIVYIIVIRPQQRKQKEQLSQLKNIRRGDTVVTTSGFIGKVTKIVDDNEFEIELAPNFRSRMLRSAITEIRTKGEPVRDASPSKS